MRVLYLVKVKFTRNSMGKKLILIELLLHLSIEMAHVACKGTFIPAYPLYILHNFL